MEQPYMANDGAPEQNDFQEGQQDGQKQGVREVHVSDLIGQKEDNAGKKSGGAEGAPAQRNGSAQSASKTESPKENHIPEYRIREVREKAAAQVQGSPEYQLGAALLRERMARDGVTAEEAHRRIVSDRAAEKAKEAKADPEKFYRDFYAGNGAPQPQQAPKAEPAAAEGDITSEFMSIVNSGQLPAGFLPEHITPEFKDDMLRMGASRALRLWAAESGAQRTAQPTQQTAQQQRQQPTTAPQRISGAESTRKPVDFSKGAMSDKEFDAMLAKIQAANARGDRVSLT